MPTNRPLCFVDLDDTLFQTGRKMMDVTRHVASLGISGEPSGYMSSTQKSFIEWLLNSTDVVPVTARSVEAYSRVKLDFVNGAICSHGGVILTSDNKLDADWHAKMSSLLRNEQVRLRMLSETTLAIGEQLGHSLRGWVVEEDGLAKYVVTKHNGSDDKMLAEVLEEVVSRNLLHDLYVHVNGNNLAFIPNQIKKSLAVKEFLVRDRVLNGERPVIGFGDSISDFGFLSECHWWGTPAKGQLAAAFETAIYE